MQVAMISSVSVPWPLVSRSYFERNANHLTEVSNQFSILIALFDSVFIVSDRLQSLKSGPVWPIVFEGTRRNASPGN